jgi:1,4-dihydroxy-2-naphthoyl-CoA synthase
VSPRLRQRRGVARVAQEIIYEVRDGVVTVTLNRPEKLNALSPRMLQLLTLSRTGFEGLKRGT